MFAHEMENDSTSFVLTLSTPSVESSFGVFMMSLESSDGMFDSSWLCLAPSLPYSKLVGWWAVIDMVSLVVHQLNCDMAGLIGRCMAGFMFTIVHV